MEQQRATARNQKSQADALNQDTAQLEKDIAELEALLKDQQKLTTAEADAAAKWQQDLKATDGFQKSREKVLAEELGGRKNKIATTVADAWAAIAALETGLANAFAAYEAKRRRLSTAQAEHDSLKGVMAVLKQHQTEGLKLKQAFGDKQSGRFSSVGKRIEAESASNPGAGYALLLLLRTELDGAVAAGPERTEPPASGDKETDPSSAFDQLWLQLEAAKRALRQERAAAKQAKDALDAQQALLDQRIQQSINDVLKALEAKA